MDKSNYINRVELQGIVGAIQISSNMDKVQKAVISLAVDNFFYNESGDIASERIWLEVDATSSDRGISAELLSTIQKGDVLHIDGRLALRHYHSPEGIESRYYYVEAFGLEIPEKLRF